MKRVFKTSDGQEFDNPRDCELWEAQREAQDALDDAIVGFRRTVLARMKTADGAPVELNKSYYLVSKPWWGGPARVHEIDLWYSNTRLSDRPRKEGGVDVVWQPPSFRAGEKPPPERSVDVTELFKSKKAAQAEARRVNIEHLREWLANSGLTVADLETVEVAP